MDFRDKDGGPLITWNDAESAFHAWQACSAGRPCDYTGLSYAKLRAGGETQWPCNERFPDGRERLYTDEDFYADAEYCESYGKDLVTGTAVEPDAYRALNPQGRAIIKAAAYLPPAEPPSDDYPLRLNTGRTLYQFHTRTKTGRAPQLHDAAPNVWVELSAADGHARGIGEGDMVAVVAPRGQVRGRARITNIRPGVVFVPFHYGYWDRGEGADDGQHDRAANELTITEWDAASKQPIFKTAACRIEKVADADGQAAPRRRRPRRDRSPTCRRGRRGGGAGDGGGPAVKIDVALREAYDAETDLAAELLRVGERHATDHDVYHLTRTLSGWSVRHVHRLAEQAARYDVDVDAGAVSDEQERGLLARMREKGAELVGQRPEPGLLLLRDLRELHLAAARASLSWTVLGQGAQAVSDSELLQAVTDCHPETIRTMKWTVQKIKEASPQVLAS